MDAWFYVLSKVAAIGLQVETWLVVALSVSVLAVAARRRRLALASSSAALFAVVSVAILPLGDVLLKPLEAAFSPAAVPRQVDGIVVLGGYEKPTTTAYWGMPQLNDAAERVTEAAALALRFPEAQVVFSGGSGRPRDNFGGVQDRPAVGVEVFNSLGIAGERVTWEDRSRNTAENAQFSFELVAPGEEENWVLLTSAFHMSRALRSFDAAGWRSITPYPVDYRTDSFRDGIGWNLAGHLDLLNGIREWVGRAAYALTGR